MGTETCSETGKTTRTVHQIERRHVVRTLGLSMSGLFVGPAGVTWAGRAVTKDIAGIPLPRGSRRQSGEAVQSSRGFQATVRFYRRLFNRRGVAYRRLPTYAYRGVILARFVSDEAGSRWSAVHVFKHRGRTWISVIARSSIGE